MNVNDLYNYTVILISAITYINLCKVKHFCAHCTKIKISKYIYILLISNFNNKKPLKLLFNLESTILIV